MMIPRPSAVATISFSSRMFVFYAVYLAFFMSSLTPVVNSSSSSSIDVQSVIDEIHCIYDCTTGAVKGAQSQTATAEKNIFLRDGNIAPEILDIDKLAMIISNSCGMENNIGQAYDIICSVIDVGVHCGNDRRRELQLEEETPAAETNRIRNFVDKLRKNLAASIGSLMGTTDTTPPKGNFADTVEITQSVENWLGLFGSIQTAVDLSQNITSIESVLELTSVIGEISDIINGFDQASLIVQSLTGIFNRTTEITVNITTTNTTTNTTSESGIFGFNLEPITALIEPIISFFSSFAVFFQF